MRKTLIALALIPFFWAGAAVAQHHKPADQPSAPAQPSQPAPPQQAQPRGEPGKARPREAPPRDSRNEPRPGQHVIVPYPGWPWWGYPYPYGYPLYGEYRPFADWETASIRLDVEPEDAQVYVDGFYAGVIDDFDGIFQHLTLHAGPHLLEIRKTGYVSLAFELNLYPGQSVTYRREMEPARDAGAAPPSPTPGFEEGAAPPLPDEAIAPPGEVRFDVEPKEAEIYADGFYAGLVNDFNGSQHLQLAPGQHHISLELKGYVTKEFDLMIEPDRSITYRAELEKGVPR